MATTYLCLTGWQDPPFCHPGSIKGIFWYRLRIDQACLLDHGFSRLMDQLVETVKLLDLALQYIQLSLAIHLYLILILRGRLYNVSPSFQLS